MGAHGMRIAVSDVLSVPTEDDKKKECGWHGGEEAIRLASKSPDLYDELKLLRMRHKIVSAVASGGGGSAKSYGSGSASLSEQLGAASLATPQKLKSRPLNSPHQDAVAVEIQLRELADNRFDRNYIEFDAGKHDGYLRSVAENMKRPGHDLYLAVEDFRSRATVYPQHKGEMNVQTAFVTLGNKLARAFHRHCPGSYEDDTGQTHDTTESDVFDSRGSTYVKQVDEHFTDDLDGPKPNPQTEAAQPSGHPAQVEDPKVTVHRWVAKNKPDIINKSYKGKQLPEKGVCWSQVTFSMEVKKEKSMDCKCSLVERTHRYQTNELKHFPAAGEILGLTICGPIMRVWYLNPQRFGSSRGFSIEDPEDYYDIVKAFAVFSGPVENYLPHWQPVAGPKGRLQMETTKGRPFVIEMKDVKSIDTRYDPFGRRTAVWSAGLARTIQVEDNIPPEILLEEDEHLIIKTSWNLPHLRHHERDVYKHIKKMERRLGKRKGFRRDPEVAIPSLVGILSEKHQAKTKLACIGDKALVDWATRPVHLDPLDEDPEGKFEKVHFTVLVTKCRRAKPIHRCQLNEYEMVEIYRKLFKNLKHLAMLGVHYRDLNLGNILCDPQTLTCLLADLDFARIGKRRRGDKRREEPKLWQTSLDDCISGNLLFMSLHVQESREQHISLTILKCAEQAREEQHKKELAAASEAEREKLTGLHETERENNRLDISEKEDEIARRSHNFIDDCESAIYTWLWVVASRKAEAEGLQCGPLYPVGGLDQVNTKRSIWSTVRPIAEANGSKEWATLIGNLVAKIRNTQRKVRGLPSTDRCSDEEQSSFDACDKLMLDFLEPYHAQM